MILNRPRTVRDLPVRAAFLFRTRSKLFRSLSDDFLFRLYKCSQFAAEYASARNIPDGLWIADFNAVDIG
jgi:hypothetical protein